MAKKKIAKKKTEQASFEQSLEALEKIVAKLESGKLELADSLDQYEQGVKHLKSCYALLNDAERRIELVSRVDADGMTHTEPFDDDSGEGDLQAKASSRGRRRTAKGGRPASRSEVDDPSTLF